MFHVKNDLYELFPCFRYKIITSKMELPRPPDDPEMKNIIDKLAQFVAR
jgi:hypothetical protein